MPPTVVDLRRAPRVPFLGALLVVGVLAASAGYGACTSRSVPIGVIGGVLAVVFLLCLVALPGVLRTRRLVIDHEGVRLERGGRRPEWRVAWTELAGVGLVRNDRERQRIARRFRANPLGNVPPGVVAVTVSVELVPTGTEAVRRHPEMARYLRLGHGEAWRVPLIVSMGEPLPIADALRRRRPDLWRGERSGPALLG
ncbi:MAG: hypothetical protein J0I49_13660 [Pseudonocardia sp.]|uniref:hypothetical protein n=1 Tax=Pseudonocardia sp. TaxID=60912 RepID=UPI001ACE19C7|nr:hypothetical protein [Pseudonocardia sp.]MBN9099142.1 hypothetical protein [Pseudonocardia sp.]